MEKEQLTQLFDLRIDASPLVVAQAFGVTAAADHVERQTREGRNGLPGYQRAILEDLLDAMLAGAPEPSEAVVKTLASTRLGREAISQLNRSIWTSNDKGAIEITMRRVQIDSAAAGDDSSPSAAARALDLWAERLRSPAPEFADTPTRARREAATSEERPDGAAPRPAEKQGQGVARVVAAAERFRKKHFPYMGRREAVTGGAGAFAGILLALVMFPSGNDDVRAQLAVPSDLRGAPAVTERNAEPVQAAAPTTDSVPPERLLIAIARVEQENRDGTRPEGVSDMDRVLDHLVAMERADMAAKGGAAAEPQASAPSDQPEEAPQGEAPG